jgi:hypothetical protein
MSDTSDRRAATWPETAIEEACRRVEKWYRGLLQFEKRAIVNGGNVVGFKHPALVSEHDCVAHFARFLKKAGIRWDAMHHQVSLSQWLFSGNHPAATAGASRWRVDLAILESERFRTADLPATEPGFQFDAFCEFAYLPDFWKQPTARNWGAPKTGHAKVQKDIEKIERYLASGVSRTGYVVVFEECDWEFPATFVSDAKTNHGCKVRFIRGY